MQYLIRGIKQYYGEKDCKPKLPITINVLHQLLSQLTLKSNSEHWWQYAIYCLAFAALLRYGEFTVDKAAKFNSEIHLTHRCAAFIPNLEAANHILLTLPASKTDLFWKRITITIAATPGCISCPISALQRFFEDNSDALRESPLFTGLDNKALTRKQFINSLRQQFLGASFNLCLYLGHSFRWGGASSVAVAGFNDHEIQLLGHWRSDTYKLYIEVLPIHILQLSSHLH